MWKLQIKQTGLSPLTYKHRKVEMNKDSFSVIAEKLNLKAEIIRNKNNIANANCKRVLKSKQLSYNLLYSLEKISS